MSLLTMLKTFRIFSLVLLICGSHLMFAATEPKERNGTDGQKEENSEQVEPVKSGIESTAETTSNEQEVRSEDEGVSITNVSFNFFFYLIYKFKYADIFKVPSRKRESTSSGFSGININTLLEKLTKPEI